MDLVVDVIVILFVIGLLAGYFWYGTISGLILGALYDVKKLNQPQWWEDDTPPQDAPDDVEIVEIDFDIRPPK